MILPPFFGIVSPYDEELVRRAIISYLTNDTLTFRNPTETSSVTFQGTDVLTHTILQDLLSITFTALDTVSLPSLLDIMSMSYSSVDVCTYTRPPGVPDSPIFIFWNVGYEEICLVWSTPANNGCNITEYILEYTDCFLSNLLTENNDILISESNEYLIEEYYRENCTYQSYNITKILLENYDRLQSGTDLLITENSTKLGLINHVIVTDLIHNRPYIFRIAAINCAGMSEFYYSDILIPDADSYSYSAMLCSLVSDDFIP